jgi:hypothetical protein
MNHFYHHSTSFEGPAQRAFSFDSSPKKEDSYSSSKGELKDEE